MPKDYDRNEHAPDDGDVHDKRTCATCSTVLRSGNTGRQCSACLQKGVKIPKAGGEADEDEDDGGALAVAGEIERPKRGYHQLRLADAAETAPPVDALSDMARQARLAVFDGCTLDDLTDIMKKQVEKAKAGNTSAASFVVGTMTAQRGGPKQNVVMIQKNG